MSSTKRLLRLAYETRRRIHVLHVSTADEIPLLAAAKDIATAEATPQHLTLGKRPNVTSAWKGFAQMNPPVRDARHRAGLWHGVGQGVIDVIGSDHAPHSREEKAKPYPASPSGMPGVQTLLPIMLDHVAEGRLSLMRLIDLVCHGPNRIFGIAGKGRLAVGYDADFTLVDMKARHTITDEEGASKCGWTPRWHDRQRLPEGNDHPWARVMWRTITGPARRADALSGSALGDAGSGARNPRGQARHAAALCGSRGYFCETYNAKAFEAAGIDIRFVQDNESYSAKRAQCGASTSRRRHSRRRSSFAF
ncbi:MAG: amidohydrolase family protein [Parvularculaceae bacterium]